MSGMEMRIAVVGMAARFPGAADVGAFWRNLRGGVESVRFFSREELLGAGHGVEQVDHPDYVPAAALLEDVAGFDAGYFGYSPREAEQIDPQQRVLLEVAAAALEDAGHARGRSGERVGVFVGSSMPHYAFNLYSQGEISDATGSLRAFFGNGESHLATRISYKLDLKGPSLYVQTACSTSLVAMHLGIQSLLSQECDVALAGGSSITMWGPGGYLAREGGILSPDGHCRAFDASARGTIIGNGAGVVVLRRLEDALRDGDTIHALVLGTAVNNDGSEKVGYTAPSQSGQAQVIAEALGVAGVEPETVTYVEAHGTGTELGDPIEVAALREVYGRGGGAVGRCGLGSVKSNFGHLLAAAGVAGVIKTVLSLKHGELPPHLHYREPNPAIDFASSPFYVVDRLRGWSVEGGGVRRAAVSSFGIGGTNAHAILEEAPRRAAARGAADGGGEGGWQVLPVSARTQGALERMGERLAAHLGEEPEGSLADVAYTLQVGRREHGRRRAVVARTVAEARDGLSAAAAGVAARAGAPVVFLFPGQGAQVGGMCAELYESEGVVRRWIDRLARGLEAHLGLDLREVLLKEEGGEALVQTALSQPALFVAEFALARWWASRGVRPRGMAGHSIGEYVAAALAGVFRVEDALAVVAARGRLMQACAPGAMLAAPLGEAELTASLPEGVVIAAVNGERSCVASGGVAEVEALEARLGEQGVRTARLRVSHGFHSPLMEPAAAGLLEELKGVRLSRPGTPFVSCVTGRWIEAAEAVDPAYWSRQLREPVRFHDMLRTVLAEGEPVLVEVGPGRTLSGAASRQRRTPAPVTSLARAGRGEEEGRQLHEALGSAWAQGAEVSWERLHPRGARRRVPLPTYPFEHQAYWIEERRERTAAAAEAVEAVEEARRRDDVGEWFYLPSWRRSLVPRRPAGGEAWLVFADGSGVGERVREHLVGEGERVVTVEAAAVAGIEWAAADRVRMRAAEPSDYDALLARLDEAGWRPRRIVHLWSLEGEGEGEDGTYAALLRLVQAVGRQGWKEPVALTVVTDSLHRVGGEARLRPGGAAVAGLSLVIPQEYPALSCRHVDVVREGWSAAGALVAEARSVGEDAAAAAERVVAHRGSGRWVQRYEAERLPPVRAADVLRPGGVYLVTGGLGGIGQEIARALAKDVGARLVLVGRRGLPPREAWEGWERAHGWDDVVSQRIRAVREMEAAGAEVVVEEADVAQHEAMGAVVARARARFGRIDGVFHTAGVAGGAMLQRQTPEGAARVLGPKAEGARVLEAVLGEGGAEFVVHCSSLASVRGGFGQGDYCAANALLDAQAWAREGSAMRQVSLNWGAWAEVGMAVEAVRRRGFLPCPYWLRSAEAAQGGGGDQAQERADAAARHPYVEERLGREAGERAVRTTLDVAQQWTLSEHRVAGRPTWPGTAYLELVRAGWEALGNGGAVEIADVAFLSPLAVAEGERRAVYTLFEGDSGNEAAFRVTSGGSGGEAPERLQEHARGRVARIAAAGAHLDVEAVRGRCRSVALEAEAEAEAGEGTQAQARLVGLGPRWNCLEALHVGEGEGLAELALGAAAAEADLPALWVHPALLDVALGVAKRVAGVEGDCLPLSYARVRIHAPLTARLVCHVRPRAAGEGRVHRFDATLADAQGRVLMEVEDYALRRVDGAAAQLGGALAVERGGAEAETMIEGAIRSHEGIDALLRALASGAPQLVVSPLPLDAVQRKWSFEDGSVAERLEGVRLPTRRAAARPADAGEYTAPQGEMEERIAALWSELLGIDRIARGDDFFFLGGDSLLGIQLHSRVKELFHLDFPLASVFENPTVQSLAALVENRLLGSLTDEELLRHIEGMEADAVGDPPAVPAQPAEAR